MVEHVDELLVIQDVALALLQQAQDLQQANTAGGSMSSGFPHVFFLQGVILETAKATESLSYLLLLYPSPLFPRPSPGEMLRPTAKSVLQSAGRVPRSREVHSHPSHSQISRWGSLSSCAPSNKSCSLPHPQRSHSMHSFPTRSSSTPAVHSPEV